MIPPINTGLHTCPREFVSVSQSKLRYITSEYLASSQESIWFRDSLPCTVRRHLKQLHEGRLKVDLQQNTVEPYLTTTLFICTTSLLWPYSFDPNLKNQWVIFLFWPIYASTCLLWPGFYGSTLVQFTGFHLSELWWVDSLIQRPAHRFQVPSIKEIRK